MEGVKARGKILYIHDRVGETGREWFHRADWADGTRSFRAVCELDDIGLVRDVTQTTTSDYLPLDCYARLVLHGEVSMGWFRFGERELECEALIAGLGRLSQRVEADARPRWFGSHPLCSDAWIAAAYVHHPWTVDEVSGYVTSPMVTGHDGPFLNPRRNELQDLGREEIEVPAGRFDARHFLLLYGGGKVQHIWVDDAFHCVKVWNEELASSYVLAELEAL
jgi:hypothetical protein